jgi:hypothetical protein
VYVNLIDQFTTPADLDQWDVYPDEDSVTVPEPGGAAVFEEGATILDNDGEHGYWDDQMTAWRFVAGTATTVIDLAFMASSSTYYYYVRMDYANKTVEVWERLGINNYQKGSTVSLPYLKPGVQDFVRVDVLTEGSNKRFRVRVNGELEIETTDTTSPATSGAAGAYAKTSTFELTYIEVNVLKTEVERVGPLP